MYIYIYIYCKERYAFLLDSSFIAHFANNSAQNYCRGNIRKATEKCKKKTY